MNESVHSKEQRNKKFKQTKTDGKKLNNSWKSKRNDNKFQNKKQFKMKSNEYEKSTFHKQFKDKKFSYRKNIKHNGKKIESEAIQEGSELKEKNSEEKFQKTFHKQIKDNKFGERNINGKDEFNKSTKRKFEESHEGTDGKKIELFHLKKKQRKVIRQMHDNKSFNLAKKIKLIWEEARLKNCKKEDKNQLVGELFKLVQGHVKELVFAHDTVLVLAYIVAYGTRMYRSSLFNELKDDVILLAKSEYGKHFLLKILQHGKEHTVHIMNSFDGKVIDLMKHKEAAEVVEVVFNKCKTDFQKTEFVQEFYGSSYKLLKSSVSSAEPQSLQQLLDMNPDQKVSIMNHMKGVLLRVLEKSGKKYSILHYVLRQFMLLCDDVSRAEVIESLREHVAEFFHTEDGSNVAMHCVWHGTAKDRKIILKHLKPFVTKTAMEEHGYMILLAIFDCVDDTKLIEKNIVMELSKSTVELSNNPYGKKVLIYLLSHRERHFFSPKMINILKEGDNNNSSKKDPQLRQSELKQMIEQPLSQLIMSQIKTKYVDSSFCSFALTVLKHISGSNKAAVFEVIAELASESYSTEKVHIIENPGSHFLLKQLIQDEKDINNEETDEVLFCKTLVSNVPVGIMKTWIDCNRGCFLLVRLLESGIPSVINRIKNEMNGLKKTLVKMSFKGAEFLLKTLKEC